MLKQAYHKLQNWRNEKSKNYQLQSYINNGRKPWSEGYWLFKENLIREYINDHNILKLFHDFSSLPQHYGESIDERIVEYPWFISRINQGTSKLLDAGSTLNHSYILQHPSIKQKEITISTLEPEENCYWQDKVAYVFSDIRNLPFKDNFFDEVASISTIEHIGMNNSVYSSNPVFNENNPFDFLQAVSELKRVTRPEGKVYISVPYGKYTNFGWYQQFNADMINKLIAEFAPTKVIESYYCYQDGGWAIADKQHCKDFEGFNPLDTKFFNPKSTQECAPDNAACSRAIAALELWK
ncbi:MAG: methyltransferase domain-containing protein [Aulosira sp. DedQUE10]|nr:methyltransferase domain-containing protein [Aulosira sp. DedQUE10]